jgi:hypothetical protein
MENGFKIRFGRGIRYHVGPEANTGQQVKFIARELT